MAPVWTSDSSGRLLKGMSELVESKKVVIMRPTKIFIIVTAALLCVAASDSPCRGPGRAADTMTAEVTKPCGCAHPRTDGERLVNTPSSTLGSTGGQNRGELVAPIDGIGRLR
jgi:hypothetical protein